MHWLFDLVLGLLIPWNSRHEDRSIVGKSPIDRQAMWIARGLIVFLVLVGLAYWCRDLVR